jgi:hypothetical protein
MRISRTLHDEFTAKLEALLDERDDVADKRRRISKALRGEVTGLDEQIAHVRRVLKGVDLPQLDIPGTEIGERKRDSILRRILDAAARIRDEKIEEAGRTKAEAKEDPAPEKAAPEKNGAAQKEPPPIGLVWMRREDGSQWAAGSEGGAYTLLVALDGNWTAAWAPSKGESQIVVSGFGLPETQAKAACETHRAQTNGNGENGIGERPEVPSLAWAWVRENVQAASGVGGTYELERLDAGGFTATFRKAGAKKATVIVRETQTKAKDACTAHHIERCADALLKAGGAPPLHPDALVGTREEAIARHEANAAEQRITWSRKGKGWAGTCGARRYSIWQTHHSANAPLTYKWSVESDEGGHIDGQDYGTLDEANAAAEDYERDQRSTAAPERPHHRGPGRPKKPKGRGARSHAAQPEAMPGERDGDDRSEASEA